MDNILPPSIDTDKLAEPNRSLREKPGGLNASQKAFFVMVLAFLGAAMWLVAIETANGNAGGFLQTLNQAEPAERSAMWTLDVRQEDIAQPIAVDEKGLPLAKPYPSQVADAIEVAWQPYAARRHLKLMLQGFGPLLFIMAIATLAAGALSLKWAGPKQNGLKTAAMLFGIAALAILARAVYLGVLRNGWFA